MGELWCDVAVFGVEKPWEMEGFSFSIGGEKGNRFVTFEGKSAILNKESSGMGNTSLITTFKYRLWLQENKCIEEDKANEEYSEKNYLRRYTLSEFSKRLFCEGVS
jgi:hypothetical protein